MPRATAMRERLDARRRLQQRSKAADQARVGARAALYAEDWRRESNRRSDSAENLRPTNRQGRAVAGSADWTDPDDPPELTGQLRDKAEEFHGDTFVRRGRGRPKSDATKEQISVRLDPDVVAKLREAGPGWQSRINALLRQALGLEAARNRAG